MTDHPDFAVGDIVYRVRSFPPWGIESEPVRVTGYDPVAGVVFWEKGTYAKSHGFGPRHLFARVCQECGAIGAMFICDVQGCPVNGGADYD